MYFLRYVYNSVKAYVFTHMMSEIAEMMRGFAGDTRAQMNGADSGTELIVGLVVASLMAAYLLPLAIEEIADVDTTGWTEGAASLWDLLPVMIVLGIFLFFVGLALSVRN